MGRGTHQRPGRLSKSPVHSAPEAMTLVNASRTSPGAQQHSNSRTSLICVSCRVSTPPVRPMSRQIALKVGVLSGLLTSHRVSAVSCARALRPRENCAISAHVRSSAAARGGSLATCAQLIPKQTPNRCRKVPGSDFSTGAVPSQRWSRPRLSGLQTTSRRIAGQTDMYESTHG